MSIMPALLALVVLSLLWSFYRLSRIPEVDFNLLDLVMQNGRASRNAFMVMGAFTLHSWIMLDLELHNKMSEGYLTIYGATWVAPILVRMLTGSTDTTTTTAATATVTTVTKPTKKGLS